MELRQLAYFVAVAEEAHFTRAAVRVSIAQPAISQQIRRLEAELGEALFVRDRRTVTLTQAGKALLPLARDALAAADNARNAIAGLHGLLTGRLLIGTVQNLPDRRLPRLVGEFHRRHPHVELSLLEDRTDALLESVSTGELDAAVIGLGPYRPLPQHFESLLVAREAVVAAVYPAHPLARQRTLRLEVLRDEPVVTLTQGSGLRYTLESACALAGFAPRVVAETSDLGLLVELVEQGVGVAIVPESALGLSRSLVRIDLREPRFERRLMLLWRATALSRAGRAFVAMCAETIR